MLKSTFSPCTESLAGGLRLRRCAGAQRAHGTVACLPLLGSRPCERKAASKGISLLQACTHAPRALQIPTSAQMRTGSQMTNLVLSWPGLLYPSATVTLNSWLGSCASRCAAGGEAPSGVQRAGLPWPPAVQTNAFDMSWQYNLRCAAALLRGRGQPPLLVLLRAVACWRPTHPKRASTGLP